MSVRLVDTLLLSSVRDFSTDIICHHLAAGGVSFLRLNYEQLPDTALLLDPVHGKLSVRLGGDQWYVSDEMLRSVWWRQSTFRRDVFADRLTLEEQLRFSQWPALMRGLMLFESASWYNLPAATYRAESKPFQLRKAALLGFHVPETRMTNDRSANLSSELGEPIAIKSVDTIYLVEESAQHFAYTNVVSWSNCADDEFHLIPTTCQALLAPKLDLRVTIVGDRLWCHAIETGGQGIEGDWRLKSKEQLSYRPYDLSGDQKVRCLSLVRQLGLRFAAIDLAVSNGCDWFIEINPTGEWAWLDSDGEISLAIAEELMK